MIASKSFVRCFRTTRPNPTFRKCHPYSTSSQQGSNNGHFNTALAGGLAGGLLVFTGGYSFYHFSGIKTFVNTAHDTKKYFENASQKLKDSSPEPNEALQWLRETSMSYATFIPGGKGFVKAAFDDLDAIHDKHSEKVDSIIKEAYTELKDVSEKGISLESAQQAWEILQKHLKKIGDLAGDAASDILNNHPEIKKKVGGNLDQLKAMGENYGPEAKKQVDQTWGQIQDIIKSGVSVESASKIRSVVQEKMELVKKMGDEAWKKGMEQAKPYLDKSPKVKELIEKNADKLKQGNVGELWEKVEESGKSGNTDPLESYVKSVVDKAKEQGGSMSGGLDQYFNMIPGADQVVPKLSKLQDIAQKHGKEAEDLVKDTFDEIQQVLQRKLNEGEKLVDKAKENAKGGK